MTVRCVWEHNGGDSILYAENFVGAFTRGPSREEAVLKIIIILFFPNRLSIRVAIKPFFLNLQYVSSGLVHVYKWVALTPRFTFLYFW